LPAIITVSWCAVSTGPTLASVFISSAMTLTRHQDGEDASTGVSYLEPRWF
jgi:hypothetical protein